MNDKEWEKLFDRVQVAIGLGDEDYIKPKVNLSYPPGGIEPGMSVHIQWLPVEDHAQQDIGYLFVMPSTENDPSMDGIVHIPYPVGGEKCQCEPEWQTLYDLERNEMIESITIPASI